ncbi:MAG TPA: type VI secretion system ATPase TssH [Phycisphaerae bacterium]|nr:type VI secretion system ATPase TssH [Phycisphaerae bacterium]
MSEAASAPATAEQLRNLLRRCDAQAMQVFQGATSVCVSRAQYEVTPEHLLLRLLDETVGDVTQILSTFKADRARLRRGVQRALDEMPGQHRAKPALSPKLIELFQAAGVLADEFGFEQIRPGLLMLALVLNPDHVRLGEFASELERINVDQLRDHFHEIVLGPAAAGPAEGRPAPGPGGAGTALAQFTIDLTAKAQAGNIDPVFGRDSEIRQMIDILGRRRKNNPIIVGEPGTGKTAIVEGLALRITQGDVPPFLRGVKLVCLDLGLLQAGAGVKGEFENRLKNVIREIKESPTPMITFIDEAHMMVGAGAGAGGGDASNLLKPALARGELRTIAATTWAEYKKYFEKDAALERRFQLVRCNEPAIQDTVVMLRGLKEKYEKHHKVVLLDEAVVAAAELAKRYVSGRFLPDSAVDLLDTAAARVAVALTTRPAGLEDLDRQLTNLDTAVAALHRDQAAGLSIDEKMLTEMEASRAKLLDERVKTEERWQKELAAVNRVRDLRAKLQGADSPDAIARREEAATQKPAGDGQPAAAAGPAPEAPAVDQAELRRQIAESMAELQAIQGDNPLLFPQVDANAVAAVLSDWTGIPVGRVVRDQIAATLQMEERLKSRVVGQDHALAIVAEKLRASKAGIGNPTQPMGVFLCVGPSGTGKTELALSVADLLFGGDRFLTSINMSEFMEKHTVSQLKGSPPGYVGYGEGGVLTEAVRQNPYSVVLLDEVEKAHPDVMNLFYQVFDKGNLADGEGRVIDFKNTVMFLTSNLGTDVIQQMCESGEEVDPKELREAIYPHLREHFKPALVARMTVIPFFTLKDDVLRNIARLKLAKVGKRLAAAHKITFKVDDAVYAAVAARCQQVDLGARQIDHVIDQAVLPILSRRLLEQMAAEKLAPVIRMGVDDAGEFTYEFSDT